MRDVLSVIDWFLVDREVSRCYTSSNFAYSLAFSWHFHGKSTFASIGLIIFFHVCWVLELVCHFSICDSNTCDSDAINV